MSDSKNAAPISLTADDLQKMIAAAVTAAVVESKKPAPKTATEIAIIEQEQELRAETAAGVLAQIEAKRSEQHMCSHKHATGESHCVYINDGNYMLCQKCQAKVRPGVAATGYKGSDIYNTDLFNRLFQEVQKTDM